MSPEQKQNPTIDVDGAVIEIGDVVQINPENDAVYGGCLVIVEELLGFAVNGFTVSPTRAGPTPFSLRAEVKNVKRIGRAEFEVPA